jgi:hypothetical protein
MSARSSFMMDSPLARVDSTLSFDHFRDKPDIRERRFAGKTDFEKFACASAPEKPRMRTNVHRELLPAGPGDSMAGGRLGPLSAITFLSSPAKLTPRPDDCTYVNSPDWGYQDFERQIIKNLNLTLAARPWTNPSHRSPRQWAVAKTWGIDGSTGAGSPVLREELAMTRQSSPSTPSSPRRDLASPKSQLSPGALSARSTPSKSVPAPSNSKQGKRVVWTTDIIRTRNVKSAPW